MSASKNGNGWPENPVQVRVRRGDQVESVHRGAWVLVDPSGAPIAGSGRHDEPIFARSSVKAFQAIPLVESGAAERFSFDDAELALALASHDGEPIHTEPVAALLARLGLTVDDLRCGPQPPSGSRARFELRASGGTPTALHNNCSGKHAGFLALALALGVEPARYLDPTTAGQARVRTALADMAGLDEDALTFAVDGCSAPTWRLPLVALATGFARLANPDGLPAERRATCERFVAAVRAHPELIAGTEKRVCTDIARETGGRLFPKVGAEGVYAVGEVGGGRGLALKMDDGVGRGMHALLLALLERFELASADELARLARWRDPVLRNRAGLDVGRLEVELP